MKYHVLGIFILSICFIVYYIYCYRLNLKLERKKRKLFIVSKVCPYKKRLKLSLQFSIVLLLCTIVSFIIPKNESYVVGVNNELELNNIVSKSTGKSVEKEETAIIERFNIKSLLLNNKAIEENDDLFIQEDHRLTKLNILTNEYINYEYTDSELINQDFLVHDDFVISYRNCVDNSYIYVHERSNLESFDKITIPKSRIDKVTASGKNIDIFFECNPQDLLNKMVKIIDHDKNEYENDYQDSCYLRDSNINSVFAHAKVDIKNKTSKVKTIFVSDYFLSFEDDYIFISSNINDDNNGFKRCAFIKYGIKDMRILKSVTLGGSIYSPPFLQDGEIYTNVVIEGENTNIYTTYLLNRFLDINDTNTIELSKEEVLGVTSEYMYVVSKSNKEYRVLNGEDVSEYTIDTEYDGLLDDEIINIEKENNILLLTIVSKKSNIVSKIDGIPYDVNILNVSKYEKKNTKQIRIVLSDEDKIYFVIVDSVDGESYLKSVDKDEYENMFISNNYVITKEENKYKLYNLFDEVIE